MTTKTACAAVISGIRLHALLLSEDDREKYDAQYHNKQGGKPHPTDSAHVSASHHPTTHRCPGHHSPAEEQQQQGYDRKRDDKGGLDCSIRDMSFL